MPSPAIHRRLHGLLQFTANLVDAINDLCNTLAGSADLKPDLKRILTKCELINQRLVSGQDLHYASFNNIVEPLMTSSLFIVISARAYLYELVKPGMELELVDQVVGLVSPGSFQHDTAIESKRTAGTRPERQALYENHILWLLKLQRLCS